MKKKMMKEAHFEELLKSVDQMGAHMRGEKVPGIKVHARSKPVSKSEVKRLRRDVLHVTQERFANLVGEGVGAVRSWEAGLRNPSGAATKIIRLLEKNPKLVSQLAVV